MPISETEGTGLVHTAVSAGTEDFQLGKKLNLPMIPLIADNADYLEGFGEFSYQNAKKHPELIFNYLKNKKGHWVYKIENYKHRYPACWRCKTELVWKVTDEWYIAMDKPDPTVPQGLTLRKQMMAVAKKINWIPQFGLERELDWLKNMHDWLISKKNRFWGLALPIYECVACGHFEVIGGKEELKKKAVDGWDKFAGHTPHKPWIDEVKIRCSSCGEAVSRIEPVGNPWLDAGIVPFSTLPKDWFPAEFITEAFPGQFKNWFYAMLVMSTVLKRTNPYQTVLGYESVVGEDGRAMHKSWGNAIEFNEGAEQIGVDVMRWMYAKALPTQVLAFGFTKANEIRRQFLLILWNSYRFFITQANADNWKMAKKQLKSSHVLDQWILSRLNQTIFEVTKSLDKFYSAPATEALESLVNDFSTWYIRRSRDRVGVAALNPQDKQAAYQTMHKVLLIISKLMAPFMPYLADEMYVNLMSSGSRASVHWSDWPKTEKKLLKPKLEKEMSWAREVVEKTHALRQKSGLKLRQPLAKIAVSGQSFGSQDIRQIILEEINVKKIIFSGKDKQLTVTLDTKLTDELKAEGEAREIIRQIQEKRKKLGTALNDKILVELPSWPDKFTEYIKQKTLISDLKKGDTLKVTKV
jgi:isoleucyl-tRNA synthetase